MAGLDRYVLDGHGDAGLGLLGRGTERHGNIWHGLQYITAKEIAIIIAYRCYEADKG